MFTNSAHSSNHDPAGTGGDDQARRTPILDPAVQTALLVVAISPGYGQLARTLAAALVALLSILSLVQIARHHRSKIAEANWLHVASVAAFGLAALGALLVALAAPDAF